MIRTPSVFVGVLTSAYGWSAHGLPIVTECCQDQIKDGKKVKSDINSAALRTY